VHEQPSARPEQYRIVIEGHLGEEWSEWFAGLKIARVVAGQTVLSGPLTDQAALHGVLIRIRDLALPLLEITRADPSDG
jgi:hypothetical protein